MTTFDFPGIDVLPARQVSHETLRAGLATVLDLRPEQIAVVSDFTKLQDLRAKTVICHVFPKAGQFVSLISINCFPIRTRFSDVLVLLQHLSSAVESPLLAPDDTMPHTDAMWLLRSFSPPERVYLDDTALEDEERYVLTGPLGEKPL